MSNFSMKPQVATSGTGSSGSDVTPDQWVAWNDYYYGLLDVAEKPFTNGQGAVVPNKHIKKVTQVGILNMIVDCGLQPQQDSVYDSKVDVPDEGEENSQAELDHIAKYPSNYFVWEDGKRKQCKPEQPQQEYAFYYDFPKIMVDWTKHPIEQLHSLGQKPLRVSYNGYFKRGTAEGNFGKRLCFNPHYKTKQLSPKNPISKIADKSGKSEEFINSGYDLGVLAESACKWELSIDKFTTDDGKTFYNTGIKNASEITPVEAGDVVVTVEQQIPECNVGFTGVLLNGMEYTQETLDMVKNRKELMAVLPRATSFQPSPVKFPDFWLGVNWVDTDLAKALGDITSNTSSETKSEDKTGSGSASTTSGGKSKEQAPSKQESKEPEIDFDDK